MDIGGISEKERRRSGLLPLLLSAALLLGGCSVPDARLPYASMTHMRTEIVGVEEAKGLARSLSALAQGMEDWNGLAFAVEQSLAWLAAKPGDETALVLPGDDAPGVTWEDLRTGLRRLLEILPYLDMNPDLLAEEFTWLRLSPSFGFTGYYEPTLLADWSEGPIYRIPLYALPPDLQAGTRYHDRHAIDRDKVLAGRDLEIAWVMDEVDVFFLHIQGSGRLVFPDGEIRHVLYAGKNGHPYVALGRVMREQGLLTPEQTHMRGIRAALREYPERREELLDANPSYIFFRLEKEGPLGSMGRRLTPKISLATDPRVLPYGTLVFFQMNWPGLSGASVREFQALGLPQDSGGAIRGRRIDFFMGAGREAEHVAGHLDSEGTVYILLPVKGAFLTNLDG